MDGYGFTEDVRHGLSVARKVGSARGRVEPQHLLIGVLDNPASDASLVLRELKVDPSEPLRRLNDITRVLAAVDEPEPASEIVFDSEAKNVLMYAMEEARNLNHSWVGSEHILLGILRIAQRRSGLASIFVGDRPAHPVGILLKECGVTLDGLRRASRTVAKMRG